MAISSQSYGFDCRSCDDKLKEERGCFKSGIVPFYIGDEISFRCPLTQITSQSWEYLKAYAFYDKGFLPNGKGWMNESQKFLDAMVIISNEVKQEQGKKNNG